MTRNEARDALVHTIVTILAEHPDLAGEASMAITHGVSQGVHTLQRQVSDARLAMTAALALMPPTRVDDQTRKLLRNVVAQAIPTTRTPAESKFLEKHT
jgi:hypothetical protein